MPANRDAAEALCMKVETYKNISRITINPGEYYATEEPAVISTLLGSCVAACLYDPGRHMIGMNHFMLSNPRYSRELPNYLTEAGRYGIQAMELLINDMMSRGARRNSLRAKVFGGASIISNRQEAGNFCCVGMVNCRFIREFLETERIPLEAEDLGGAFGRVIHFSNGDYAVHRRTIDPKRSTNLARRDRDCWQRSIEKQADALTSVELWS